VKNRGAEVKGRNNRTDRMEKEENDVGVGEYRKENVKIK
jgi:hypothetical protein